jgi:hypothetical protein
LFTTSTHLQNCWLARAGGGTRPLVAKGARLQWICAAYPASWQIPRPAFEVEGVWVYGFGLSLHIIKSRYPEKRMLLKGRRLGE